MFYATKKTTKNLKEYLTKIKTNLCAVFINTLLSTFFNDSLYKIFRLQTYLNFESLKEVLLCFTLY